MTAGIPLILVLNTNAWVRERHIKRIRAEKTKLIINATDRVSNSASSIYLEKIIPPWEMRELMEKFRSSSAGAREIPGYR
jgi:hypothetical protein